MISLVKEGTSRSIKLSNENICSLPNKKNKLPENKTRERKEGVVAYRKSCWAHMRGKKLLEGPTRPKLVTWSN